MPRYRRQIAPGSVQHIISRFVDRTPRFDRDGARQEYLRRAAIAVARTDWKILAYALMSSHVHWALQAGTEPSASFIQRLHSGFASWLNAAERRLGPVFADRHRNIACDGKTASSLIAYIHNNPGRAGLVSDPAESTWTSHRAYVGLAFAPDWLDVERGLSFCGFAATTAGRKAFHGFVLSRAREPRSIALSGGDLERRRRRVRARLASPVEIASPKVVQTREAVVVQTPVVVPAGCFVRRRWAGTTTDALAIVASARGLTVDQIRRRSRMPHLVDARRLALLIWTVQLGSRSVHMARALGLTESTAVYLVSTAPPALHQEAETLARALGTDFDSSISP